MKLFQSHGKIRRVDLINNTLRIYAESGNIVDVPLSSAQLKEAYKLLLSIELDDKQKDNMTGNNN